MAIGSDDMGVFFGDDFAVEVTPTTWGTDVFNGIFDRDYVELEDIGRVSPFFITAAANVPATAAAGDLFTIDSTSYKLVDLQPYEIGLQRVVLADV
jgi:hypothetical protein